MARTPTHPFVQLVIGALSGKLEGLSKDMSAAAENTAMMGTLGLFAAAVIGAGVALDHFRNPAQQFADSVNKAVAAASAADKDKKRLAPVIRGLRGTAGEWRISLGDPGDGSEVLDEDEVRADYWRRGMDAPMTAKPGNAPRLSVHRIKKAAAK